MPFAFVCGRPLSVTTGVDYEKSAKFPWGLKKVILPK